MITSIVIGYAFLFLLYYQVYLKGRMLLNPMGFFAIRTTISYFGTLSLLDLEKPADTAYLLAMSVGVFAIYLGGLVGLICFPVDRGKVKRFWLNVKPVHRCSPKVEKWMIGLCAFSVLITILYFTTIGYNLFFEMLKKKSIMDDNADVAGLRLNTYAGEKYFAPGYVNQFKNTILPILSLYFLNLASRMRKRGMILLALGLLGFTVVGLMGTGQRAPLLMFGLIGSIFWLSMNPKLGKRLLLILVKPKVMVPGALVIALFGFMSSGLRRVDDLSQESTMARVGKTIEHLGDRILLTNQRAGVVAFRYIHTIPVTNGREWATSVMGLLPSHRGSDLNNIIFSLMWGSTRGNAPPSLVGSIWHNFGLIGVPIVCFIIGFCYHRVYYSLLRGKKSVIRLLCYAALTVIMGMWISGTPIFLLNKGLLAVVLLLLIDKVFSNERRVPGRRRLTRKARRPLAS